METRRLASSSIISSDGVRQGSGIGPMFFNMFPLSTLIAHLSLSHYICADYIQLFLSFIPKNFIRANRNLESNIASISTCINRCIISDYTYYRIDPAATTFTILQAIFSIIVYRRCKERWTLREVWSFIHVAICIHIHQTILPDLGQLANILRPCGPFVLFIFVPMHILSIKPKRTACRSIIRLAHVVAFQYWSPLARYVGAVVRHALKRKSKCKRSIRRGQLDSSVLALSVSIYSGITL